MSKTVPYLIIYYQGQSHTMSDGCWARSTTLTNSSQHAPVRRPPTSEMAHFFFCPTWFFTNSEIQQIFKMIQYVCNKLTDPMTSFPWTLHHFLTKSICAWSGRGSSLPVTLLTVYRPTLRAPCNHSQPRVFEGHIGAPQIILIMWKV